MRVGFCLLSAARDASTPFPWSQPLMNSPRRSKVELPPMPVGTALPAASVQPVGHDVPLYAIIVPTGTIQPWFSALDSLSLRLSTFPTSRFHCEDCNWLPVTFPRRAEGSVQLYVRAKAIHPMKSAAKEPNTAHRIAESRMDLKFAMRLVFYAIEERDVAGADAHSVYGPTADRAS